MPPAAAITQPPWLALRHAVFSCRSRRYFAAATPIAIADTILLFFTTPTIEPDALADGLRHAIADAAPLPPPPPFSPAPLICRERYC
jgi:hypothetical protein